MSTQNTSGPGTDSAGNVYQSTEELWAEEFGLGTASEEVVEAKKKEWYKKGVDYWCGVDASVNGVLGGFGHISKTDVLGSTVFLRQLKKVNFDGIVADCGGGIGRTCQDLHTPLFAGIDLIEPTPKFVEKAKELMKDNTKMENYFQLGLEEWTPEDGRYSLIWCQWVLPHLTDDDLVAFFKKCIPALAPGGVIGVKENIGTHFVVDREDTSMTRTDAQYKECFEKAGLKLISEKVQLGFPRSLLKVKMYACVPMPIKKEEVVAVECDLD